MRSITHIARSFQLPAQRRTHALVVMLAATLCSLPVIGRGQSSDFSSSDLPILMVDTDGAPIRDEPKIVAWMSAIDNGPGLRNHVTDPPGAYDGHIGIELRGSTSRVLFDKKSYAVETRLPDGSNNNVSLLGLPVENDWVLHGPYSDKTLIRNALSFELYRRMGRYASRFRFCELLINGQYMGVYVVLERIKRDNDRVDIAPIGPQDLSGDALTGGYIIKVDKSEGAELGGWFSTFPTMTDPARKTFYQYHYPTPSEITTEQETYIQAFIRDFETAAASPSFMDPENGYPAYLDRASTVDYILINELTNNVDAYRLSTFLYKDRDSVYGKLVAGPPWDFNIALGNANYYEGEQQTGFRVRYPLTRDDAFHGPFWWTRILDDPTFADALGIRWQELRSTVLPTSEVLATIDSLAARLDEAQRRNFERWPVLDEYVWPNVTVTGFYDEEINYLKWWISGRMNWLDSSIDTIGGEATGDSPDHVTARELLTDVYPNPASLQIEFRVSLPTSQRVRISLNDAMGRRVRELPDRFLGNDLAHDFTMHVEDLAAGVYILHLVGDRNAASRTVAVVGR